MIIIYHKVTTGFHQQFGLGENDKRDENEWF